MTREELFQRMEALGVTPKRALGQNFLVSENVIERILEAARKQVPKDLIEIGPGLGALTDHLRGFASGSFRVIELDELFAKHWRGEGLEVLEQDALHWNWSSAPGDAVLVSNLPYQISASLVVELSSLEKLPLKSMILMFQKEVAERITAKTETKDYGIITVLAQNRWDIKKVVDASPACFHPRPQVASRVLLFTRRKGDEEFGSPEFMKFVKAGFQNRRKLLIKSLKAISASVNWEEALGAVGSGAMARAEELKPSQWRALFEGYQKIAGRKQ